MMTAEDFCRFMWKKYLVERQYDILGEILDEQISVIGTGAHEISRNLKEFIASIEHENEEWSGSFIIKNQWYQTTQLSDTLSLVIGELGVKEDADDGILFDVRFRFSAVLRRCADSWKLVHIHQSVPDPNQAYDEFFPHRMVEKDSQQIIYNLRHDSMTGLLNRVYLKEIINRSMLDTPEGLMLMIDVDKFKHLNDTYGHPFGDKVLIVLAQSLKASFPNAVIGRVGGDEFVVYITNENADSVKQLFLSFKDDWEEAQRALQLPYTLTVSIGAAWCPVDGTSYDEVWRNADKALYYAKKNGENQICYLHEN